MRIIEKKLLRNGLGNICRCVLVLIELFYYCI